MQRASSGATGSGGRPVLRIRGLPVDGLANETMVVRLDFTELPVRAGQADQEFVG